MKIIIKVNSKILKKQTMALRKILYQVFKKATKHLKFSKEITISVQEVKEKIALKDLNGIGAFCSKKNLIILSLDAIHPSLRKLKYKILAPPFFHELHHVARRQAGINISGGTFFECLWSEGLADNFVFNMTGKTPIWVTGLGKSKYKNLFKKAKQIFKRPLTNNSYKEWFLDGSTKKGIPRWAGYAIGYQMVRLYLKNHSYLSCKDVSEMKSKKILEDLIFVKRMRLDL